MVSRVLALGGQHAVWPSTGEIDLSSLLDSL
jgi:hypothetical protein